MNKYIITIIFPFVDGYAKNETLHSDVEEALVNWEYAQQCSCPEQCGANIRVITPFSYE